MSELLDPGIALVLFPLVAFVITLSAGHRLPLRGAGPGIVATGGSLLFSVWLAAKVLIGDGPSRETVHTFVEGTAGAVTLEFGVLFDPLSVLMLVVVSLVAFLVHLFSLGYMNAEGERDLSRYYAALALFTFSMLAFVASDNLLMSFVFFELVGLCSYLLIGFWFRREGPPSAAKKAFLVTRFGDYFFLVGVVAVFALFGTATFAGPDSFVTAATDRIADGGGSYTFLDLSTQAVVDIVGLLVLGGVLGKSAQFPLHTWLPDAMEGPTPVSALIHAATMVAAGVYLLARMYGFYTLSPRVLAVIALVGGFTALFAATMALVKQELKQVLAYSTISQYGYMMLALGGGGYVAAVFHLATHAVFKALLFLGAGAVIVAMHHEENMWEMGGLKDELPVTYYTFLAGSFALAGIFPFAGFWSKDEVLFETLEHALGGATVLWVAYALGLVAVVVTALYTFRMVLLTFHGEPRTDQAESPDPVAWSMKLPMVVLGVLATVAGVLNLGTIKEFVGTENLFLAEWLDGATIDGVPDELLSAEGEYVLSEHHYATRLEEFAGYEVESISPLGPGVLALALALAGAGAAWYLYAEDDPEPQTTRLGRLRTVLANNYYQDEYQVWLARDLTLPTANRSNRFDRSIVDGFVNAAGAVTLELGTRFRRLQTGIVSNYATLLALALGLLVLLFAVAEGWWV